MPDYNISNISIDMTDKTELELIKTIGKLADAVKTIVDKNNNSPRYGIYINNNQATFDKRYCTDNNYEDNDCPSEDTQSF